MNRPIMTKAELDQHHHQRHGRDYEQSDDGYEDMGLAESQGWTTIANWGHDGWDLGEWPYVAIYTRVTSGKFEVQQIVEGDHDIYRFDNEDDQHAAIDYLFLWYAAGRPWAPLDFDDRDQLDAGDLEVNEKYRGPMPH
jgi:hypothetical protein